MSEKNLQTALEDFKEFVQRKGWSIVAEREIQSGRQLVVTDGVTKTPVNIFSTGKLLVQGKTSVLQTEIQLWWQERNASSIKSSASVNAQLPHINVGIARTAQFYIARDHIEKVKPLFSSLKAQVMAQDSPSDPHQLFRIGIHRDNERVTATQYKNGTLLIQGKTSKLFEDVYTTVENSLQSFAERGVRYVPDSERDVILEHMSLPQTELKALDWVYKELGQQVYEFLSSNDRETYLSGAGLLLSIEEIGLKLTDYSIIVMPFARSYEGFIIQLAIQLGITNEIDIRAHAGSMRAGDYLNQVKEKIEKIDKVRYGGLVDTLQSAWRDVRNKVLHSDPVSPPLHQQLVNAMHDIQTINRAMDRGHKYLVRLGIIKPPVLKSQSSQSHSNSEEVVFTEVDAKELQVELKQSEHNVATRNLVSNLATAKTTGIARIGLDESGKGDYFGPLVIAAVYVDAQTEAQLVTLGVRDSKLLPDNRILAMAEAIKTTCPHFVVSIGPKTYNEMYEKFQNLNQLLAWGHAWALEKILEKVSCNLAIADQFGDESYLRNALLEKGRQIKLEQRPRAESDIAVAAASILARADFVQRMEQLSKRAGKMLPKGAFDPSIVTIGRQIVAEGGESALAEVAKLHFKTTNIILQG